MGLPYIMQHTKTDIDAFFHTISNAVWQRPVAPVRGNITTCVSAFQKLLNEIRKGRADMWLLSDWVMKLNDIAGVADTDGHKVKALLDDPIAVIALRDRLEGAHLLDAWQILGGVLVWQLGFPKGLYPLWYERNARYSQGYSLRYFKDGGKADIFDCFHVTMLEHRLFPCDSITDIVKRVSGKTIESMHCSMRPLFSQMGERSERNLVSAMSSM